MKDHEEYVQEKLDRIHNGEMPPASRRRVRRSRLITFVDLGLIIIVFLVFKNINNKQEGILISSEVNGVKYAIAQKYDKTTNDNIFFLTIKSNLTKEAKISFPKNGLAEVNLFYKDTFLTKINFGSKIKEVTILPGEIKQFSTSLNSSFLKGELKNKNITIEKKNDLFSRILNIITLQGKAIIKTEPAINLDFKFEVKND